MTRTSWTIAAAIALGATAAIASAAPIQPAPDRRPRPRSAADTVPDVVPAGECSVPSREKCLSTVKVAGEDVPYLETPCGIAKREACRDAVSDAIEAYSVEAEADSAKPRVSMLRPNRSDMPVHLRDGKYKKFAPSNSRLASDRAELRSQYAQSDDLLAGYGGFDTGAKPPVARKETVLALEALQYWRNKSWDDNREKVASCKEYAYSRSFTAARFIDASSACRGDKECIFDAAYFVGNGGIADRKLTDEGGNDAPKQLTLPSGVKQKNEMFPQGIGAFVRANGLLPKLEATQDILDLEAALTAGQSYYSFGQCQGSACDDTRKFKNIWTFHSKMHTRNFSVGEAEAEEYARRLGRFRALLDKWHAAIAGESPPRPPRDAQEYVSPLEMRAYDPFVRYDLEDTYMERGREQRIELRRRFGRALFDKSATEALQQIRGAAQQQGARESIPAVGLLGMPAAKPAGDRPKPVRRDDDTPNVERSCQRPDEEWGLETDFKGPISCAMGKFLRSEWARVKDGQRSCLDPDNARCDWTLEMFTQSLLVHMPALDAQVADEQFCKAFLTPDTFKDTDSWPGTSMDGKPNVTRVRARLEETKRVVEEELKAVDQYRLGRNSANNGQILGKDWKGGDYVGDKETFGAGYDYDVGWRVTPAAKVPDNASEDPGLVCELEGSVHGNMSFDAYLRGKKFPIVSGAVQVRSKPNQAGNAEYKAHLKMFDMSLYQSSGAGWAGTQTFGADAVPFKSFDVPDVRPRFDVMVGPVPVSGQIWGELMFGSGLEVGGVASTGCDADQPRFAVDGTYMPFFMAFGKGQVGVGIAGLVSAGIRASLLLTMISTPITFGLSLGQKNGGPAVKFGSDMKLLLGTLSGRVSLYLEFLLYEEEFELFRWKGLMSEVPLMKLAADVSFVGLK